MAQTKKLDRERWSESLSIFSNGNRGRMRTIEAEDLEAGDQLLAQAVPLFAIDYDPADKGDDLVVTTGMDEVGYTHRISAPEEIWEYQDDLGRVMSLEVINRKGSKSLIIFKSLRGKGRQGFVKKGKKQ